MSRRGARGTGLRFLVDEHVHLDAVRQLAARGTDAVFVGHVGLGSREDAVIFEWARREGRIVVTRNYADFAPLVEEANRQGVSFPGILFLAPSLRPSDAGAHVRAIEDWCAAAAATGGNPVRDTFGWLSGAGPGETPPTSP